ncbi:LuxR C-terminal-related transcriptional regulator [Pedobacter sp.]|uniref:LuxR C-terminal-related transcriptional regulator n=1 Tax=Pedobacter sp. TaxID=1411316 RepID=UPI003D7F53E7
MQNAKVHQNSYASAGTIWNAIAAEPLFKDLLVEFEFHKKLLHIFQLGDFYHYLYNLNSRKFEFISAEMPLVLGYPQELLNSTFFLSIVHPEDLPYVLGYEKQVVNFFCLMKKECVVKYKVRYDFRVRKSSGNYIRLLHQMLCIIPDNREQYVHSFCVDTDITFLKKDGFPVLSFIGTEGEPSYVDVGIKPGFSRTEDHLTFREKEIIMLLSEGYTSKEIGRKLFISPATVTTHRKNILRKTGVGSTPKLVNAAISKGWI